MPSHQILTNNDGMIAVRENTIVTLGQDQENLLNYDALTGKQSGATQVEALNGIGFLTTDENGTYYIATKTEFLFIRRTEASASRFMTEAAEV